MWAEFIAARRGATVVVVVGVAIFCPRASRVLWIVRVDCAAGLYMSWEGELLWEYDTLISGVTKSVAEIQPQAIST